MKTSLKISLLLLSIFLFNECKKDSTKPPVVITLDVTEITKTTAISGGEMNEMTPLIVSKGICWSTEQNPTTENFKTIDFSKNTSYLCSMTGLIPKTKYYVRATKTHANHYTPSATGATSHTTAPLWSF
jgi:hypothetical protein